MDGIVLLLMEANTWTINFCEYLLIIKWFPTRKTKPNYDSAAFWAEVPYS